MLLSTRFLRMCAALVGRSCSGCVGFLGGVRLAVLFLVVGRWLVG